MTLTTKTLDHLNSQQSLENDLLKPPLSQLRTASILATGSYLPERVMTNHDLEKMVETSDEWIQTRTGIKERRIVAPGQTSSDMGAAAAQKALAQVQLDPIALDMIICGTMTPDMACPSTACLIQKKIGASNAICFDVSAACSGFLYPLEIAEQFIATGRHQHILVIGAETISSIVDWNDRSTCVLFGDGAGAVLLGHRPQSRGIIASHLASDGSSSDILCMKEIIPEGQASENCSKKRSVLTMNGRETYKKAVPAMVETCHKVLQKAGVSLSELTKIIPHQANQRIIEAVASRLGLPLEHFFLNLDRYGNTSAATIGIALDEAAAAGQIQRGDLILLVTFGGGLSWGSILMEW